MRQLTALGLTLLAAMAAGTARSAEPLTTGTLIEEMVDLARLADYPEPAFHTVQYSSYDRRSSVPGGPDWFANADGFGGEPIPGFEKVLAEPNAQGVGEYLICDVKGPGAIVRTWTAGIAGTIRVWLDGADKPLFDGPAHEFLHGPYRRAAEAAGIDLALFDGTFRQRDACYFPIPFAKRCRIVWTGKIQDMHFYEVQVRHYAPGTAVTTYSPEDLKTHESAIARVGGILADPSGRWPYRSKLEPVSFETTLQPGEAKDVVTLDGPKAIERLTLQVQAGDVDRALRQTVLRVVCDGHPWGQVQSPIGDFFGAAPGINPFDSVPFTVQPDGQMTCRYVMPFAQSCSIRLENRGPRPVTVQGSVLPCEYVWNDARSMHFRARWRVDHGLRAGGGDEAQDLPFLVARGQGVYVGTTVMMMNPSPAPSPYGSWWGEGDEKVFIDDDARPSTFGTGSEDYFNYSWSVPDIFGYPYCGQPRDDGPANRGFVVNQRWHILDALPFAERIGFYMELLSHLPTPGFSYARIGYHYGRPGIIDDHVNPTDRDLEPVELPANWMPIAALGSHDSTFHQAEDALTTKDGTTLEKGRVWAGARMLVWKPTRKGEELTFKLPVAQAGRYAIRITAAHRPGGGRFSAMLDGKPVEFDGAGRVVDLATDFRTLSRTVSLRPAELTQGDHELTLRAEDDPATGHTIGLDFFWVQP
ncbi:MAG: DUF2961 domain-containing protein [Pirellulales bacterium]|nr:DUF2961 domain-containing protein [Pirellulales bacterium]